MTRRPFLRRSARPLLAAATVLTALVASLGPTSSAIADPIVVPFDLELDQCTELVPHTVALTPAPVRLDVRVLLDGVDQSVADAAIASMRRAYGPLGITVRATYEAVTFASRDADKMIAAAKDHYGGRRPAGVDVVYALTSKDLGGGAYGDGLAGLADCIGGVRFPDRAFAVGEDFADTEVSGGTAKTMAHEIGHLMGGHHHWSSAEGVLAEAPNALTLMGPDIGLVSLRFSTVNGAYVRAHAQRYAR